MKHLMRTLFLLTIVSVSLGVLAGCSEDDDPITPTEDPVEPPSNLEAYSDEGAVGISWAPSTSEAQSNFAGYTILVIDVAADDTAQTIEVGPGNGHIVTNLANGVIYRFEIFGRSTSDNLSSTYRFIRWAPASRHTQDNENMTITVYATSSLTEDSGLDIYNAAGLSEVIPQASQDFVDRGDLYVDGAVGNSYLEIKGPQTATNFQGMPTRFASSTTGILSESADNLSEQTDTAPPLASDYTATGIVISDAPVAQGKVYFGRLERGSTAADYQYFRMLVKRGSNGSLVQGTGTERYVELEFSFQTEPGVQFSKTSK